MNSRHLINASAVALLTAALALPMSAYAHDRDSGRLTVGYRGHYDGHHYDRHHHHYRHHARPAYGPVYGYYAPRTYYYSYHPGYYYRPAPQYYYGPSSGWSVDLHYFFRD